MIHPAFVPGTTPSPDATAQRIASPLAALSLKSDQALIGPVLPEDTGAIFLWLNDVEAANLDLPYRPVDWMSYNNWLADFAKNPSQVLFAIRRLAEARIVGFLVFTKINPVHRCAEIGVRIGNKGDRGKGLGKEALSLGLNYAWKHLNLNRVQLSVFESNHHAIQAYRSAGFQPEGTLRQAAFIDGVWQDVIVMGALRPSQREL